MFILQIFILRKYRRFDFSAMCYDLSILCSLLAGKERQRAKIIKKSTKVVFIPGEKYRIQKNIHYEGVQFLYSFPRTVKS